MKWQLHLFKDNRPIGAPLECEGVVDLGRQDTALDRERAFPQSVVLPFRYGLRPGVTRVVMALSTEKEMLRHVELEVLSDEQVRLKNLSRAAHIQVTGSPAIVPEGDYTGPLPAEFRLDKWTFRAQIAQTAPHRDEEDEALHSLTDMTAPPGSRFPRGAAMSSLAHSIGAGAMESENLIRWLQAAMDVLQEATSSKEFLPRAARAVVELVDLDGCRVLLHDGREWATRAEWTKPGIDKDHWRPSAHILQQLRQLKRTLWQVPTSNMSVANVSAVVAAPILSAAGEVIGALYGDRGIGMRSGALTLPITKLEAMLVEVLARGVAAGLARVEQEQIAVRSRVQLEAAMGPRLAAYLAEHPEANKGKDAMVTILFCDVRKFSTHSEKLGPEATVEWIGKVMSRLSECVQRQEGVIVDFIGDELMAMWGAPAEQPDHAVRACRAALEMLECLPALNVEWNERLKGPMDLGIGINSGVARVGDVGTEVRRKYGALGNTVNRASRVQGATKHLKTRLLITRATKDLLDGSFATRRVTLAEVVNIEQPVELFELSAAAQPIWSPLQMEYQTALEKFEARNFRTAARVLSNIVLEHPEDGPALVLLSRAVSCMVQEPAEGFQIWTVPGK